MNPPSKPTHTTPALLRTTLPALCLKTNLNIAHLNRLLSTTPHLDTTLLTLNYTLHLLHSILPRLPASPSLTSLALSINSLTTLIDEHRIFLRLWSLLSIYAWGLSTLQSPPKDPLLKSIAWAQVGVNVVYQALENAAFLGDKGVLRGVSEGRRARWWVWSSRAWMAHVGLEGGRLGREWVLRRRRGREFVTREKRREVEARKDGKEEIRGEEGAEVERAGLEASGEKNEVSEVKSGEIEPREDGKEEDGMIKREEKRWWREVGVNAAYAPMTVHWSVEEGILNEAWVGGLGVIAGVLGIREAWRETA